MNILARIEIPEPSRNTFSASSRSQRLQSQYESTKPRGSSKSIVSCSAQSIIRQLWVHPPHYCDDGVRSTSWSLQEPWRPCHHAGARHRHDANARTKKASRQEHA